MSGKVVVLAGGAADRDWRLIRAVLPDGWREGARMWGAIRRRRGPLSDPEVQLRVLLGLAAGNHSLRGTSKRARRTGVVSVSHMALHKRLKRAADWLDWIVREMLQASVGTLPEGTLRLRLIDATCVSRPGSKGTDFRLHVNVSLPARTVSEAELTDERGGESLTRFAVRPGDVMVADRAYGVSRGIAHVAAGQGYVVVRINGSSLPLFGSEDARVDPLRLARKLAPGAFFEISVEVRPRGADAVRGRLCLFALPKKVAEEAQRRVRQAKHGTQKRIGKRAIENAKYVFVYTTLPKSYATTRQVFGIYRLRWQVELAFKTLKRVCGFARLPHRKHEPGRAWLLAKLLCALIAERLANPSQIFPPHLEAPRDAA